MFRLQLCIVMLASAAVHALTQDEMETLAKLSAKAAAEREALASRQRRLSADASIRVRTCLWPLTCT